LKSNRSAPKRTTGAAFAEIEKLRGARFGTPEGDRLDALTNRIVDYDEACFPLTNEEKVEEARLDAEAMADARAGRVVSHERVREWLMKLAKGIREPPPHA
jgi:predicted transcriptional regulator